LQRISRFKTRVCQNFDKKYSNEQNQILLHAVSFFFIEKKIENEQTLSMIQRKDVKEFYEKYSSLFHFDNSEDVYQLIQRWLNEQKSKNKIIKLWFVQFFVVFIE
jgi:hypothetical protein